METMGSWGKASLKFMKSLGPKVAEETGEKQASSYLFQSMGIATMRGNAMSISGTVHSAGHIVRLESGITLK